MLLFISWSKTFSPSIITLQSFISPFGKQYSECDVIPFSFSKDTTKTSIYSLENLDQLSDLNIGSVHMFTDLIDIYSS